MTKVGKGKQNISRVTKNIIGLGILTKQEKVYLYYYLPHTLSNTFHVAVSKSGFFFVKQRKHAEIQLGVSAKMDVKTAKDFSFSDQGNYCTLTFIRKQGTNVSLEMAYSSNLYSWEYEGNIDISLSAGIVVSQYLLKGQQVMYLVKDSLSVAYSKDRIEWKIVSKKLLAKEIAHVQAVLEQPEGLLLIYDIYKNGKYCVFAALFDKNDPTHLLWEPHESIWIQPDSWKKEVTPLGVAQVDGKLIGYWQVKNEGIFAYVYALYAVSDGHSSKDIFLRLQRHKANPLIVPKTENSWEAFNTFNPAAIYDGGKVHILYRAQGYDYVSTIGYASSTDGIHITERYNKPIYNPTEPFAWLKTGNPISFGYVSGGGYGGCEDPRITKIDDRYYLTYVAFDGYNPPRIALTSIAAEDFLHKKWLWEKPILISPPGVVDKSAVIFPEKIKGKYVIMHRIYPDILIDFVDSLEFDGETWLKGEYKISPRPDKWDSRKIGAGAPPIKTKYGWLLIYQSVGEQDSARYKIGAMLLDLEDPTKVLYRSQSPILEPDAFYENNGFKAGVIYPCGAVIIEDMLYVYYGGADSYVCVATANLDKFLDQLRFSKLAKLTTPIAERIAL